MALADALWTVHKESEGKEPCETWKAKACIAEHSMLADVRFIVKIYGIPNWVSQHLARHDVFTGHTLRESKEIHYVATQRTDRTGVERSKLPQDTPVDHRMSLSAKDLITISRLRLCTCASKETREVWRAVLDELAKTEPTHVLLFADHLLQRINHDVPCDMYTLRATLSDLVIRGYLTSDSVNSDIHYKVSYHNINSVL